MAQAIHCDGEGHLDALADVMVTNLANGDTSAWCFDHYVVVCRAIVDTFDQAAAQEADAQAAARLEGVTPPEGSDQEPDAGDGSPLPEPSTDVAEGASDTREPDAAPAPEPGGSAPDLSVGTFRPAGDESEPEGLGSSETGETRPADESPAGTLDGAPGPSDDGQGEADAQEAASTPNSA